MFQKAQRIFEIGPRVQIGGQPGELPTVLIGSIFYSGDTIVKDHAKGDFEKNQAEQLLKTAEELSEELGNPHVLDVVGTSGAALIRYIDFVSKTTDQPFLIDGASPAIRLEAARHVAEVGLLDRAIYNSIDEHTDDAEVKAMKEIGIKSTMLLAFSMKKMWPEGRIEILKGYDDKKGLIDLANEAGVANLLVDTAVVDLASIGLACRSISLVKSEFGLPAGCAPCNASTTWAKTKKKYGEDALQACDATLDAMIQLNGGNFILYGPVIEARRVFPACAVLDALVAYTNKRYGISPRVKNHPLYRIW